MPRMLAFIIVLLIVGLIAGALARLLVPGRDPIGLLGTIVLGVLGSFLGGFILNLIEYHTLAVHHLRTAGIIGSIAGALILLILYRLSGHERGHKRYGRSRGRSRTRGPDGPAHSPLVPGRLRAAKPRGDAPRGQFPCGDPPGGILCGMPRAARALGRTWTQAT